MQLKRMLFSGICSALVCTYMMSSSGLDVNRIFADENEEDDIFNITVYPHHNHKPISPYIYGINNTTDLSDVTVNVVKNPGGEYVTYNWENNNYNTGSGYGNVNRKYESFSSKQYGMLDDDLVSEALENNIPVKLTTLPMMGYVSADASGTVPLKSALLRFIPTSFIKPDSYLLVPDTYDDKVYIDEYVSYLLSQYGDSKGNGFSGYFLDSEPESWGTRFGVVYKETLTADKLIKKSAELANSVKNIDPYAMIFGPSVKNMTAYVNLNNPDDSQQYIGEYSWFIDYYLDRMKNAEDESGKRLLDVLDLHYYTEHYTAVGTPVLTNDDELSDYERVQAVRTLYDSAFTENSTSVILNKQHTPIIPTVQASIRMYYPGTKLSLSEYNFGGGARIGGGIAEADVLGAFAANDVYLACLMPDEKCDYQKAAINIYTNYDGNGKSFGDTFVKSTSSDFALVSAYSSVNSNDNKTVTSVIINKDSKKKDIYLKYDSDVEFNTINVYSFDRKSPEIKLTDKITNVRDNDIEYTLNSETVYLFETQGNSEIMEEDNSGENTNTDITETDIQSQTSVTEDADNHTESDVSETDVITDKDGTYATEQTVTAVTDLDQSDESKNEPPVIFKVIVSVLVGAVTILIVYVYFIEIARNKNKK